MLFARSAEKILNTCMQFARNVEILFSVVAVVTVFLLLFLCGGCCCFYCFFGTLNFGFCKHFLKEILFFARSAEKIFNTCMQFARNAEKKKFAVVAVIVFLCTKLWLLQFWGCC